MMTDSNFRCTTIPGRREGNLGKQRYLDDAKAVLGTQRCLDDAKAILGTQRYFDDAKAILGT